MPNLRQGSIHLFQVAGIDLYLHWSWFVVAAYEIQGRKGSYSSVIWNVFEYLALFLIVMLHEFGHALACRQVGGTANRIMLWPLGGVAYVNPPQRPGATLWSIAAGPLVNVALLPVLGVPDLGVPGLGVPALFGWVQGWAHTMPNAYLLIEGISLINFGLLIFNILPFYPLDGGQILRSLLWFVLGRARSLMWATIFGLLGIVGFFVLAVKVQSVWIIAISIFMLMNCWDGLRHAQALLRIAKLPRRQGFACPSCRMAPPAGAYWQCGACRQPFDTFETRGACPRCGAEYSKTMCLDCQEQRPMSEWIAGAAAGVGEVNGGMPVR
jgi:Zn-dependent protease